MIMFVYVAMTIGALLSSGADFGSMLGALVIGVCAAVSWHSNDGLIGNGFGSLGKFVSEFVAFRWNCIVSSHGSCLDDGNPSHSGRPWW